MPGPKRKEVGKGQGQADVAERSLVRVERSQHACAHHTQQDTPFGVVEGG